MIKTKKELVSFSMVLPFVFFISTVKAENYSADSISSVSKIIAENKLMNTNSAVEQREDRIHKKNSLENKTFISTYAPKIETSHGLKSFSQDQVDPIIWYKSDTYLRSIPIYQSNLSAPGEYSPSKNEIMIDYSKMANPKFSKIYTPRGPDPEIVIAHEVGHARFEQLFRPVRGNYSPTTYRAAHEDFADYFAIQFDKSRQNRFAVESNIARDLKNNGYNVKIYNSYNQCRLDQSRWNYVKPPKIGN